MLCFFQELLLCEVDNHWAQDDSRDVRACEASTLKVLSQRPHLHSDVGHAHLKFDRLRMRWAVKGQLVVGKAQKASERCLKKVAQSALVVD